MPQLFTFLHCLNPKPRAITAQNNLWPLSTSLGLSPFLLFCKATASDWDETNSLGASELRAHPGTALGFSCEQQSGAQGWAPRLPNPLFLPSSCRREAGHGPEHGADKTPNVWRCWNHPMGSAKQELLIY